jgi:two-component system response regulator (stage 0 sporulation protein A)
LDNTVNIVVADDNKDFCNILKDYLETKTGFCVAGMANDGFETLNLITMCKPDILILDMIMPQLDGLEVLDRINKGAFYAKPRVIVLSSLGKDSCIQKALELGVEYYIVKPFELDVLAERISDVSGAMEKRVDIRPVPCVLSERSILEKQVTKLMLEIGIPASIKGYHYLRDSILLVIKENDTTGAMTKIVYPTIAKQYSTTSTRVERAIRHAIEVAWTRGRADVLEKIFGFTVNMNKGKPTNSEFINLIADKIRIQTD